MAGEEDPGAALDSGEGGDSGGPAEPGCGADTLAITAGGAAAQATLGHGVCRRCRGSGHLGDGPCPICGGTGVVKLGDETGPA